MAIKKKKIPYYFLLFLLTFGAIGIIGLLSFTGMFTLIPLISLAAISFVLSVIYEGEIYLQNIKGAFNKLTKHKNTELRLANDYLLRMFDNNTIDTKAEDCPKFFKDYEKQLKILHKYSHKRLDEESEKRKRKAEKTLKDMEKFFANQLYSRNRKTNYELELYDWLIKHGQAEEIKLLRERKTVYKGMTIFSVVCGAFMSLGVGYLLVEAITVLAGMTAITAAALPPVIIPLALVAGAAYVFLIYNSITDMIHNDSLRKWYYHLKEELGKGITFRKVVVTVAAGVLFVLAIALTLCTWGTWWSIAKAAGMPNFFAGTLATMLGGSQLFFNLENTSESLEMIDQAVNSEEKGFFAQLGEGLVKIYHRVRDKIEDESWLQLLNPFRLIILFTVTPLRLILFAGHLISIGVTADRVPGVPEIVSAILGIISEGFEDFHYFIGDLLPHKHGHSTKELLKERHGGNHAHNHENDIPTRMIHFCFLPVYALAAGWDWLATRMVSAKPVPCGRILHTGDELSFEQIGGKLRDKNAVVLYKNELYYAHHRTQKIKPIKLREDNREAYESLRDNFIRNPKSRELISTLTGRHGRSKTISWNEAWDKHRGLPPVESVTIKANTPRPSEDWQFEQTIHRVETHIEKHLEKVTVNPEIAKEKVNNLKELKKDLFQMKGMPMNQVRARVAAEVNNPVYSKHRFFGQEGPTATEDFLHDLTDRSVPAA